MNLEAEMTFEVADWVEDEALCHEEAQRTAIRPRLAIALAISILGDPRECIYQLAYAFAIAADQERRSERTRKLCRLLSDACDRLWLVTAPSYRPAII
jgi:hypothetical protein